MFAENLAALGTAAPREALPLLREKLPEDEATRAYLFLALTAIAARIGGCPGSAAVSAADRAVIEIVDRHLEEITPDPELPGALIERLIVPERRRGAGEFYTPRWLAERTVMLSGFVEADDGVLLDPCCGGGAMLVAAMRLRGERLEQQGLPRREIASQLVARVSGYDLNPLAVLASRVACWAVLGQWIPGERPELQIEVGDALGENCEPFASSRCEPFTSPPAPLLRRRQEGGAFDKSNDVEGPETAGGSIGRSIGLGGQLNLFVSDSSTPDGASSAPLPGRRRRGGAGGGVESCQVSFLVGNPPWIRWSDVPAHQAERVREVARELDLIPRQVWHGGSEVDLSVVIALATSARHLKQGGRSSLVLPRSHLHAPASAPFRRLTLPDGTRLKLEAIEDFEAVPAFRGASVKPVVAVWSRTDIDKPVACARYEPDSKPTATTSWAEAAPMLRRIDKHLQVSSGRWCLVDPSSPMVSRLLGETSWVRGRKGVTTDLNEAYFVRVLGYSGHLARVVPLPARGKLKLPAREFEIESDLLWPLLKGAGQIEAFRCVEEPASVILPNSGIQQLPTQEEFAARYPAASEYFARLERDTGGALSRRATYRRTQASHGAPYFVVYNVGDYTFKPFKVVWPEITSRFRAAVAVPRDGRAVVPDHKVYFAAFDQIEPADFLCAFLNAPMVRHAVEASTARLQIGTLLRQIQVPAFDPGDAAHAELARVGAASRQQGKVADAVELKELVARVAL